MARFACADWIGPTVNEGDGDGVPLGPADAMGTVIWDVLHIQEGTEAGTESWQRNPASQVSSHFLLPKVGRRPKQMVDTHDRSWCQVAGNRGGISMECEGRHGDALTGDQIEQAAQIVAESHRVHGAAVQVCNNPNATTQSAGGLIYHAAGGTAWGGHFDCPGDPIIAQRPLILARAQQILNGDDMPFLDDPNAAALSWRVDALHRGTDTVQGGPTAGEDMWIVKAVKALAAGQIVPPPAVDTHALATDITGQLVAAGAVGLTTDQLHAAVKNVLDGATIHAV